MRAETQAFREELFHPAVILARVSTTTTNPAAPALKEWAAVVHALLEGEQVVDVRKGGLREEGRHFDLPARRFFLSPTAEHQKPELLKPAYAHWVELADASPVGEPVVVHGWADVIDVATITEAEQIDALDSKLIWTRDYVRTRFSWKQRDPLWTLVLRVHRLQHPLTVGWRDEYGGCTSWITYDGLPADPASLPSEPVLSDVAFEAKRKGVRDALGDEAFSPR
jgi:hypothetical protein